MILTLITILIKCLESLTKLKIIKLNKLSIAIKFLNNFILPLYVISIIVDFSLFSYIFGNETININSDPNLTLLNQQESTTFLFNNTNADIQNSAENNLKTNSSEESIGNKNKQQNIHIDLIVTYLLISVLTAFLK